MIFTLNTRDNILWDIIRNHLKVSPKEFNTEINFHFQYFLNYMNSKQIEYNQLKSALIPNRDKDKYELLLCFDTNLNPNITFYEELILEIIFSLLNKNTVHSIHTGDFICERKYQEKAYELLSKNLIYIKNSTWIYSSQYYFVYLNNVTKSEYNRLLEGLEEEKMYVGFCNFTYNNDFKDLLAYILGSKCIKKGDKIIFPSITLEESFYSFKDKGYLEYPIEEKLYFSFLDYKIESSLIYAIDVSNSINAICPFYIDLSNVSINVKSEKLEYLKLEKANIMKRSGMEEFSENDLIKLLKEKIRQNYIFNLEFDRWGNIKFNILFEIICMKKKTKILAAFKYNPKKNEVDLITLF